MKYLKFISFIFLFLIFTSKSFSEEVYFINLTTILNDSKAGSSAQEKLKKDFENQDKKFKEESNALKKEETELISKKKTFKLLNFLI